MLNAKSDAPGTKPMLCIIFGHQHYQVNCHSITSNIMYHKNTCMWAPQLTHVSVLRPELLSLVLPHSQYFGEKIVTNLVVLK